MSNDSNKKFSETDIIKMIEVLIDNIFTMLSRSVFQQTIGITMGTNCTPLLIDLVLSRLRKKTEQKLGRFFIFFYFTFRFVDDMSFCNIIPSSTLTVRYC